MLAGGDSQGTGRTRRGLPPRPCDLPEGARPPGGAGWHWLLDRPLGARRPSTAWGSLSRIFLLCQMKVGFYKNQHQEKKECPPRTQALGPSTHSHFPSSRVLWACKPQSIRTPTRFSLISAAYWNIRVQADGLEQQISKGKLHPRQE